MACILLEDINKDVQIIEQQRERRKRQMEKLMRFFKDEEGVTAIEYGLIAALIAIVIILALTAVGGELNVLFKKIEDTLNTANA
jgi:pilus assembly protein Flp/PilA